jgi:hypothetical protein
MFRHRDEDLLPFPLRDTIPMAPVLEALGYYDNGPVVNLIEEGRFDAYKLPNDYRWRISHSSFQRFLQNSLPHS